jgi:hypothetical protein
MPELFIFINGLLPDHGLSGLNPLDGEQLPPVNVTSQPVADANAEAKLLL